MGCGLLVDGPDADPAVDVAGGDVALGHAVGHRQPAAGGGQVAGGDRDGHRALVVGEGLAALVEGGGLHVEDHVAEGEREGRALGAVAALQRGAAGAGDPGQLHLEAGHVVGQLGRRRGEEGAAAVAAGEGEAQQGRGEPAHHLTLRPMRPSSRPTAIGIRVGRWQNDSSCGVTSPQA